MSRRVAIPALCLAVAGVAVAEVRVVVRPDGSQLMYNVGGSRRQQVVASEREAGQEIDLESVIGRYARESRLDADLVKAVIRAESSYDPQAVSRRGAMGLMQLMPATARSMAVGNPFDPDQNVRAGTRYLRQLMDAFDNDLELALAAYNAGPEAVRRFNGIPPYRETVDYVEKVMRHYRGDPDYVARSSRRVGRGRRTYLTRDNNGVLVLSTTPPHGG